MQYTQMLPNVENTAKLFPTAMQRLANQRVRRGMSSQHSWLTGAIGEPYQATCFYS